MQLIELSLFIILCILIFKIAYYFTKRIKGLFEILKLKKLCGAEVKFLRSPLKSFFSVSKKPDIAVTVGDNIYLLRLISGKGSRRHLHFASKNFYVTFLDMHFAISALFSIGRRYKVTQGMGSQTSSRQSVKILPSLEIPEEYKCEDKKTLQVLLINPAPYEVTYVTEERTSIKAAFDGDDVYGQKIFTASTFGIYADRVKREKELFSKEKAIFRE